MKRRTAFIALLTILISLTCTQTIAVYLPGDIRPADEYSDPDDYELIFMDTDGWELRMTEQSRDTYVIRYTGVLLYGYGSSRYVGNLEAIYYSTEQTLEVTCTDPGWHDYTLSYGLHPRYQWRMYGAYLYFETGTGSGIYADIVKGDLDGLVPYGS